MICRQYRISKQLTNSFKLKFLSSSSNLKTHYERRLVRYSQNQIFKVVSDVDEYHEFVPWCKTSQVTKIISDTEFEADLTVGFGVFTERYSSKVALLPPSRVVATSLSTKLLDSLKFEWVFSQASKPNSCWVAFKLEYSFRSSIYNQASEVFFADIVNNMITAFEKRCQEKFGGHHPKGS